MKAEQDAIAALQTFALVLQTINLIFGIIMIVSLWALFAKAGRPGWAAIVPIYNAIVFLDIIDKPWYHIFLFLIPCVNIYFAIVYTVQFAEKFGASAGFAVGMIFLGFIFYPILAFGDYRYSPGKKRIARYDDDDEDEDYDDRPRSRRRDDDDDDRPRRRSRDDDDDDEDDEPRGRRRRCTICPKPEALGGTP